MATRLINLILFAVCLATVPATTSARYMDPYSGRFVTADTFEGEPSKPRTLHKYAYCENDPVNLVDPSGHIAGTLDLAFGSTLSAGSRSSIESARSSTYAAAKGLAWTLVFAIGAGSSLSGSTYAAQEQAAIQSAELTLAGHGSSVANELAKARQAWRTRNGNLRIPKIVPVPASVIPLVAQHVAVAQLVHGPVLQRANLLVGAKNRYQVLKGRGSAGPGLSWDEYPFFSSAQGGRPNASLMPVPQEQNWLQGGIIGGAYTIEKISPGDSFYVIVTP